MFQSYFHLLRCAYLFVLILRDVKLLLLWDRSGLVKHIPEYDVTVLCCYVTHRSCIPYAVIYYCWDHTTGFLIPHWELTQPQSVVSNWNLRCMQFCNTVNISNPSNHFSKHFDTMVQLDSDLLRRCPTSRSSRDWTLIFHPAIQPHLTDLTWTLLRAPASVLRIKATRLLQLSQAVFD